MSWCSIGLIYIIRRYSGICDKAMEHSYDLTSYSNRHQLRSRIAPQIFSLDQFTCRSSGRCAFTFFR